MAVRSASASKPKVSAQKEKTSKKENMKKVESRAQSDDNGPRKLLPNSLAKRTKCPGIRVKGGRIYDSENGKTCHQCRQKTRDFVASCKVMKGKKQCTISFCHKCLLNRYGEKAEEMAMLDDWKCPKCRGICNCSNCMKKRGHKPTGILVHAAKATGFSSVSEMLHMKGPENSCHDKIVKVAGVSPKRTVAPNKENPSVLQRKRGKENSFDENIGSDLQHRNSTFNPDEKKPKKMKQEGIEKMHDGNRDSDSPLKNSNTKKPQVSKETSKEIVKKNGKEGSVMLDKKQSRMRVSRDVSSSSIKKEGKNGGRDGVTHKVVEVSDCSKIDNAGAKPSVILDKKQSKVQVSREVYSSPIKKEEKNGGRDEPTHKVIEVLDCSTTDSEGSKPKTVESHKVENCTVTLQNKNFDADIPMPQGTELTTIAGVELLPEDVGQALQFLEFCATFGKVLNVKKVQAESVLHELTRGPLTLGRSARRGQNSLIVWFHTQLLSLILKDMGEEYKFPSSLYV
ncbi:hypothetical protein L1049_002508 [Liquidambar formosana]|uniref:DDT domain-containing protein n=1 Tax=Liquidambar formosana TaxID=63359 RepID=A0AAP0NG59_LIQFO